MDQRTLINEVNSNGIIIERHVTSGNWDKKVNSYKTLCGKELSNTPYIYFTVCISCDECRKLAGVSAFIAIPQRKLNRKNVSGTVSPIPPEIEEETEKLKAQMRAMGLL